MKQLKLSHCVIRGEACLQALGVVLALKPIHSLSLERVLLPEEKVTDLHDGWRALTRLEITVPVARTSASLALLDSLQSSGSRLVQLL